MGQLGGIFGDNFENDKREILRVHCIMIIVISSAMMDGITYPCIEPGSGLVTIGPVL